MNVDERFIGVRIREDGLVADLGPWHKMGVEEDLHLSRQTACGQLLRLPVCS